MSEANTSEKKKSKSKKHRKKRHYTVLPYFNYALLFFLISMIVVVPILLIGMNGAVNKVHEAQEVLGIDYNDLEIDNTYNEKNGTNYIEDIKVGKRIGTIEIGSAGVYENVYYGTNRVTMRQGAGMDIKSYLPGNDGCTRIAGYASSSFKGLYKVNKGDKIILDTYWGKFEYRVTEMYVATEAKDVDGNSIVLATFTSTDAFACQNGKMYYVVGTLTSKEVL